MLYTYMLMVIIYVAYIYVVDETFYMRFGGELLVYACIGI